MAAASPGEDVLKILVVGQTPPPYHGQAINTKRLLDGEYSRVKLFHVRMAFSGEMDEIGRFRFGKLLHLLAVVVRATFAKFRHGISILYYMPAGPDRVPMYRDLAILIATRWLFRRVVFQFRAAGLSELYERLTRLERFFFRLAYRRPDLAIRSSEFNPPDGEFLGAKRNIVIQNGAEDRRPSFAVRRRGRSATPSILFVGVLR